MHPLLRGLVPSLWTTTSGWTIVKVPSSTIRKTQIYIMCQIMRTSAINGWVGKVRSKAWLQQEQLSSVEVRSYVFRGSCRVLLTWIYLVTRLPRIKDTHPKHLWPTVFYEIFIFQSSTRLMSVYMILRELKTTASQSMTGCLYLCAARFTSSLDQYVQTSCAVRSSITI